MPINPYLFGLDPTQKRYYHNSAIDGIMYDEKENFVTVSKADPHIKNAAILKTYKNKPVTIIDEAAFCNCKDLLSVSIPNTVRSIVQGAFSHCEKLEEVTLPESVDFIDGFAFIRNQNLKQIYFPFSSNLKVIAEGCFTYCDSLEAVTIPSAVKEVQNQAFFSCNSLKNIDFSKNSTLTSIGYSSFAFCEKLSSLIFPQSVKKISPFAFKACSSLESVVIPDHIETIDKTSFENCKNITHVRFSQALVDRSDSDDIFTQIFNAGLRTREVLLRIPSI